MADRIEQFSSKNKFWGIVQLVGRTAIAGLISQEEFAGAGFVRVDVPALSSKDVGFTELFGTGVIYSITPTTEEAAKLAALDLGVPVAFRLAELRHINNQHNEW